MTALARRIDLMLVGLVRMTGETRPELHGIGDRHSLAPGRDMAGCAFLRGVPRLDEVYRVLCVVILDVLDRTAGPIPTHAVSSNSIVAALA
jgi:hypothetical protein